MQFGTHRAQYEREARGYIWLQSGLPPVLRPGLSISIRQEQPWHPGPFLFTSFGFVVDTTVRPEDRFLTLAREQPWHPQPYTLPALVQLGIVPTVLTPEVRFTFVPQAQPWHPQPIVQIGVQGPNVASGVRSISVKQEQPWHPLPYVLRYIQFQPWQLFGNKVTLRQQDPWHPQPFTLPFRQYIAPPVTKATFPPVVILQEYPGFHPRPFTYRQHFYTNQFPIQTAFPPVIENLTNDMLAEQIAKTSGGVFYTDSADTLTLVNRFPQQYDPVGWMSVGGNIHPRGFIGIRPYAQGSINNA